MMRPDYTPQLRPHPDAQGVLQVTDMLGNWHTIPDAQCRHVRSEINGMSGASVAVYAVSFQTQTLIDTQQPDLPDVSALVDGVQLIAHNTDPSEAFDTLMQPPPDLTVEVDGIKPAESATVGDAL